jgi:endothelin-converting enzyme/putative endopeptidase
MDQEQPHPARRVALERVRKLAWENQRFLWGILDGLAKSVAGRSLAQQKIGDYFAACMDEAAAEKSGGRPLKPTLDRIFRMKSKRVRAGVLVQAGQPMVRENRCRVW